MINKNTHKSRAQNQMNKHIHTHSYYTVNCKLLVFIFIFCSACSFLFTQCSSVKVTRQKKEQRTVFQKVSKSRNVFWIREAARSNTESSCRLRSAKQKTRTQWRIIWTVTLCNLCRHCQYNFFLFFKMQDLSSFYTHTHKTKKQNKKRERERAK